MWYDRNTENKSFKNMWHYLQRYDIKNNIFMLTTINKSLLDFSMEKWNNLNRNNNNDYKTLKMYKNNIMREIRQNIWFYFREIVLIPDNNNPGKFKHFNLTPETMMMIYLYNKNISYITSYVNDDILMTQYFLWIYNRYYKNNELIITNNVNTTNNIIKNINCNILNSKTPVPLSTTEMMHDAFMRCIFIDDKSFTDSFDLKKYVNKEYNKFININNWIKKDKVLFVLDINSTKIYNKIFNFKLNDEYKLFLLGYNDINIDKSSVLIYDKNNLKDIYLI